MDRFIDVPVQSLLNGYSSLKSNMDRFIAEQEVKILEAIKKFKIQYG